MALAFPIKHMTHILNHNSGSIGQERTIDRIPKRFLYRFKDKEYICLLWGVRHAIWLEFSILIEWSPLQTCRHLAFGRGKDYIRLKMRGSGGSGEGKSGDYIYIEIYISQRIPTKRKAITWPKLRKELIQYKTNIQGRYTPTDSCAPHSLYQALLASTS